MTDNGNRKPRDFTAALRAACVRWVGSGFACLVCQGFWKMDAPEELHEDGCPAPRKAADQ